MIKNNLIIRYIKLIHLTNFINIIENYHQFNIKIKN